MSNNGVEVTRSDMFTLVNKKSFMSGKGCVHPHTHEIVIQRKGCKRLIRLKYDDKVMIQSR